MQYEGFIQKEKVEVYVSEKDLRENLICFIRHEDGTEEEFDPWLELTKVDVTELKT